VNREEDVAKLVDFAALDIMFNNADTAEGPEFEVYAPVISEAGKPG
jgi:hypothetical protein